MKDEKKFQTLNVITISFAHLTHDIYSSFLAPILPLLISKFNLSYSLVGLLRLFQRLPSLMNPFVGLIADRVSVRYFLIIAPALTTVSMSLLGCAPNYAVLAVLLFVTGISAALFHVPGPVMIKHVAGHRVGMGMSFYMLGGELARTVGPLIILGAVSLWTLEGTYKLIPFGLTASILLFFRFRNIEIKQDFKGNDQQSRVGETLRKLLPFFLILTAITFFREIIKSTLTNGIFMTISFLLSSLTVLFIGIIADHIGLESTFKIAAIAALGGIPFVFMLPKSKRKIKE